MRLRLKLLVLIEKLSFKRLLKRFLLLSRVGGKRDV
jgi:hypothetical protein